MAQYTVTHSCGHSHTHNLFGKVSERERRLEWLKGTLCPECWKKEQQEKEDKQPIKLRIVSNGLTEDKDGNILAFIVLTGGTRPKKDEIKKLGYRWGEVPGGIVDLFSGRQEMAWFKTVNVEDLINANPEIVKQVREDMQTLGAKMSEDTNPIDTAMVRKRLEKKKEEREKKARIDAKIAEIEKPVKPSCHPANKGGRWNGKIYGSQKTGWSYYVDGKKYNLTQAEYEEMMQYNEKWSAYQKTIESIKANN